MVSTASTNALPMNCPWRNKLSPSPRPRRGVHIVKVCPVDNIYLLCYTATCLSSIAGAGYSSPFPSHQGVHTRWFGRALEWHSRGQRFDPAYLHQAKGSHSHLCESFAILSNDCKNLRGRTPKTRIPGLCFMHRLFMPFFGKPPTKKEATMRKDYLKNYLKAACKGRAHRKISQELEHTLGLIGTQLRELVNRLRKERIPIASDSYGYFYASTAGEVYETIRFLQRIDAGL